MSWVARAKEAFLGVSAHHNAADEADAWPARRWDASCALQIAINSALAGSPDTHPATLVFSDRSDVRSYLILADTASKAAQLRTVIAPLAPKAEAVIHSLDENGTDLDALGVPETVESRRFDIAIVAVSDDVELDLEAFFGRLGGLLSDTGALWLNLSRNPAPGTSPSAHISGLVDDLLRHVPSRWRLKDQLGGTIAQAAGQIDQSAANALRAGFDIVSQVSVGGTLLGPLFANGCISPDMEEDAEGRQLVQALYRVERDLIESGEIVSSDVIYLARPRRREAGQIGRLFEKHAGPPPEGAAAGMSGPLPQWVAFNLGPALRSARAADHAAPFPPADLMYHTTGLNQDRDFAQHGADILKALSAASPRPLNELQAILDFGVGVGRVARYFKGFAGRYVGVDIDEANLNWVSGRLPWVEAVQTEPAAALPFEAGSFDGVTSISVFTHIDRSTTDFYIDELHRITRPGGLLFLTLHGERALGRALAEEAVGRLVGVPQERLEQARTTLAQEGFDFAEQYTHLTRQNYRYGTTFLSQAGAEAIFGRRFRVLGFVPGAIHSFQDLIVLEHA